MAQSSGGCVSSVLHRQQEQHEQGDAQAQGMKVKNNSEQGQRVLSWKTAFKNVIPAALSELEALRNVSQVVMEKSLPRFLQTEEQSISANRLKQTILFSAEG